MCYYMYKGSRSDYNIFYDNLSKDNLLKKFIDAIIYRMDSLWIR